MTEISGAYDGGLTGTMRGIVSGVKVATAIGWRPIEAITIGDRVLTFDCGLQEVIQVQRKMLWSGEKECPRAFWPLAVPKGALGNRDAMTLLPYQAVMVESDAADAMFGDPFALIPAGALAGMNGIEIAPPRGPIEVIVLQFADDQIVFANSGALYLCPAARDLVQDAFFDRCESNYYTLPMNQARALTQRIEAEVSMGFIAQSTVEQMDAVAC